jgi:two-component system sensor histidine kinase AlgZ
VRWVVARGADDGRRYHDLSGLLSDSTRRLDMNDTEILSAFADTTMDGAHAANGLPVDRSQIFDACHVGVVLRAVVLVQLVLAVVSLFGADSAGAWLYQLALLTGTVLPATLLWLVVACLFKQILGRQSPGVQVLSGAVLGMVCAGMAVGVMRALAVLPQVPWLATMAAAAVMAASLVLAWQWRARAQLPAAQAARLAMLQARIRPHFLFNALNSAIALVRQDPAKAEQLLQDLSDLFRRALAEQGEHVTLAQELDLAQQYLGIEQLRFGERLRVHWSLDAEAEAALLPPLLLQPLLENAVKHGVEPSAQGADVWVRTQRRGERVRIVVSNTLAPQGSDSQGLGLALGNVRERLLLLHDVQAQFHARLRHGRFEVRLEVPL